MKTPPRLQEQNSSLGMCKDQTPSFMANFHVVSCQTLQCEHLGALNSSVPLASDGDRSWVPQNRGVELMLCISEEANGTRKDEKDLSQVSSFSDGKVLCV